MAFVYLLGNLWGMGKRMDTLVLILAVCVYFISTHTEWRRWKRRLFRMGIAVFLFLLAAEHAENEIEYKDQYLSQLAEQMPVTVQGTLYKKEYKNKQYLYYLTDCYAVFSKGTISTNDVIAYLQTDDYSIGQILIIHAKVKMFDEARNEGNFDLASFYAGQKIDYALKSCRIDQVYGKADRYREGLYQLKKRMERIFKEYLSKKEAGTVSGMILGDKSEMDEEVRKLYQNGGISHILAISGLHVSMIGLTVYRFLRKRGSTYLTAGVVSVFLLWSYAQMTGNGISVKRAVGMLTICLFAAVAGKSYDLLTAMGILAVILVWENPFLFEYSGFIFSFGAVMGIGIVGHSIAKAKEAGKRTWKQKLKENLLTSLGIQLMTVPIVACYYYEVPVYALLLNFLVLPLLSYVILSGIVGGVCGVLFESLKIPVYRPVLVRVLFFPCSLILKLYDGLCEMTAKLPNAQYICGAPEKWKLFLYYALLFGAILLWNRRKRKRKNPIIFAGGLVVLLFVLILSGPRKEWKLTVLDVGQGDAVFLRTGDGTGCFFDGGSTSVNEVGKYRILPFLKYNGEKKISYWFVSHGDEDHISGLLEVFESGYPVEYLVLSEEMPKDEAYDKLCAAAQKNRTEILLLGAGDTIQIGDACLQTIFPTKEYAKGCNNDRNMLSQVLYYEEGEFRALFAGDLPDTGEKVLTEQADLTQVQFLKAVHHGSKSSNSVALLDRIRPEITAVSCARDNSYGHPAKETIQRLKEVKSSVFYTMKSGQLTIRRENKGFLCEGFVEEKISAAYEW